MRKNSFLCRIGIWNGENYLTILKILLSSLGDMHRKKDFEQFSQIHQLNCNKHSTAVPSCHWTLFDFISMALQAVVSIQLLLLLLDFVCVCKNAIDKIEKLLCRVVLASTQHFHFPSIEMPNAILVFVIDFVFVVIRNYKWI